MKRASSGLRRTVRRARLNRTEVAQQARSIDEQDRDRLEQELELEWLYTGEESDYGSLDEPDGHSIGR